jgi:hypothetical protein
MICLACGFVNNDEEHTCAKCHGPLARAQHPPRLTARLVRLQNAVQNLLRGQITCSEYEDFMDETEEFLLQTLEEVKAMEIPEELKEEMKQEMQLGIMGIEIYISSISHLRQYLSLRNTNLLDEGLKKAEKANEFINTALSLNWKSYHAFRESTEEYIRSSGLNSN